LTSYRAAPPRVKPCLYVASTVNFWEARVPSRDGTYVAIASCLGKGAAHFYPTLCGKSHPQEKPQFSRTFRSPPPCRPSPPRRAGIFERQIARRRLADVEMLMIDRVRRHDHGADLPVVAHRLLPAVRPHQRVALAAQDDHMRAGRMRMRLLVGRDRKLRDVRG